MPSRKEKKLEVREQLILQAASHIIIEDGFANLSMDAIAAEVGISKTTLYQHFRSKEDVVRHALKRSFHNVMAFMHGLEGRAIDRLEATMRYMMETDYAADGFPLALAREEVLHAFVNEPEIAALFKQMGEEFDRHIDEAKHDGDIHPDLPNPIISSAMIGLLGLTETKTVLNLPHRMDEIINYAVQIFRGGIKPPS
ncbi:MAG: TetR/AcrR family transcriptional regulator [Chloroflexi bacterium]|nr:TetR/AcrR family transcriptional regulator [Chloroflexota bacterium]